MPVALGKALAPDPAERISSGGTQIWGENAIVPNNYEP